jgi:hypothetical protein
MAPPSTFKFQLKRSEKKRPSSREGFISEKTSDSEDMPKPLIDFTQGAKLVKESSLEVPST